MHARFVFSENNNIRRTEMGLAVQVLGIHSAAVSPGKYNQEVILWLLSA